MEHVEHITWHGQPLAYVIRAEIAPDKTTFLTENTFKQQVGFVVYPRGLVVRRVAVTQLPGRRCSLSRARPASTRAPNCSAVAAARDGPELERKGSDVVEFGFLLPDGASLAISVTNPVVCILHDNGGSYSLVRPWVSANAVDGHIRRIVVWPIPFVKRLSAGVPGLCRELVVGNAGAGGV